MQCADAAWVARLAYCHIWHAAAQSVALEHCRASFCQASFNMLATCSGKPGALPDGGQGAADLHKRAPIEM